ncbi:hypothetical protein [Novosphingobium soli]|uniref:Uncharacterized protein n=1 Tax=Novosphingobium soli TaxID=574956 RepID=A0ABV6CVJ5_9SPHN
MRAVRALQKRVVKLEHAAQPRPSLLAVMYGSFDAFVEIELLPDTKSGALDRADMIDVVAALRACETDGTWHRAHAR